MASSHHSVCQPPLRCSPAWSLLSSAAWLHHHCAYCIRGYSKFRLLHIILQKLKIAPSKDKSDLPSSCTNQLLLHTWRRGYRRSDASFFLCWDTQFWGPLLTDRIEAQEKKMPPEQELVESPHLRPHFSTPTVTASFPVLMVLPPNTLFLYFLIYFHFK